MAMINSDLERLKLIQRSKNDAGLSRMAASFRKKWPNIKLEDLDDSVRGLPPMENKSLLPIALVSLVVVGGAGYYIWNKTKTSTVTASTSPDTTKALSASELTAAEVSTEGLNPEQAKVYTSALSTVKEPEKLEALATAFEKSGKTAQAKVLRKRAAVAKLPKPAQKNRKAVFKKAMNSKNPKAVKKVAHAFADEGCIGAAAKLKDYASALETLNG